MIDFKNSIRSGHTHTQRGSGGGGKKNQESADMEMKAENLDSLGSDTLILLLFW